MKLSPKQKQQIIAYFRLQPEVAGVYLYGSQVTGGAGSLSDVDLAVLLSKTTESKSFDRQLEYIGAVQEIVREDLAADVKILDDEQALIYRVDVINKGKLIVNNRPKEVSEFVNRVGLLYPDFYPVLQNYYQKMHERLENGTYAA